MQENVSKVRLSTRGIKIAPALSTSAYAAGESVGGIQTLTDACRPDNVGELVSLLILDRANQKAPLDILIFDSNPTAATAADSSTFAWSTADAQLVAHIAIATGDYVSVASEAIAHKTSLGFVITSVGSANLYAVVVTTGTPTYAVNSLQFNWGFKA